MTRTLPLLDTNLQSACMKASWRRGVVVITTAQLHSSKPELRFCAGSNPARGVSEIRDGEGLWQWSRLEKRLRLSSVNHTTKTIHHWSSSIDSELQIQYELLYLKDMWKDTQDRTKHVNTTVCEWWLLGKPFFWQVSHFLLTYTSF